MAQFLKEHKKEAIINAAIEVMQEKGITNMDMRTVAKKAGITVGNLYRYFNDKQALIDTIIGPLFERVENILVRNSQGIFSLNKYERLNLSDDIIRSNDFFEIIVNVTSESHKVIKQYPTLAPVLLKDDYVKNMLTVWIESLWVNNTSGSKRQRILLRAHINSIVSGITYLLIEGVDLGEAEFKTVSEFYVQSTHKTILNIISNFSEE